jgi:hypothetical protein
MTQNSAETGTQALDRRRRRRRRRRSMKATEERKEI